MPSLPQSDDLGDAAIDDYLARMDAGEVIDQGQFIAEHPESADALRSFFASELLFRQLVAHGHTGSTPLPLHAPNPRAFAIAQQDASLAPWPALPVTFGRYRVTKLIGRGAMGTVYRALDTELDRQVALKIPHRSADSDEHTVPRDRHLQEARSAAGLRHPNICGVFDVGQIDGIDFIAMEFIEGRPLSDFLRDDRLPPAATVVGLIRRLALALRAAHAQGVIHRDLKPENILVRKDGEPVLMDFGLACRPVPKGAERLSQAGMMIGSPAYMAPEQARGDGATVGPATDIYGLGVVFYELLTGRLPFAGSVMTILAKILTEDPPSILLLRPDTDRELAGICHRMLSKRPEDRFSSMQEVADALKDWQRSRRTCDDLPPLQAPSPAKSPTTVLRRLPPQEVASLTRSAQRCLRQRDYLMAVKLLSQIPQSQHSEESASTLHRAQDLAEEVDYLSLDIDEALDCREYGVLETALQRFLELQPHNRRARDLQRRLVRRGNVIALAPATTTTGKNGGFFREHLRGLILGGVGLILLFVLSWAFADRYLSDPRLVVDVQVDEPEAVVRIDGEAIHLEEGHGAARLIPGEHTVDAQLDGAPRQAFEFAVARGRPNRVQIAFRQLNPDAIAVAGPPPVVPDGPGIEPMFPEERQENSIGMWLARIPPGEFMMGSPETEAGREANEGPQRRVRISKSFLAGAYEVTQTDYLRVMGHIPDEKVGDLEQARAGRSKLPIDYVTWYDAIDFCNRLSEMEGRPPAYSLKKKFWSAHSIQSADVAMLSSEGYRLPTSEEWEYLCRAGTTTPFHFGTQCNGTQANVNGTLPYGGAPPRTFLNRTRDVGSYPPNAFGVFDTHGNAAEWCWSSSNNGGQRLLDPHHPVRGGGIRIDTRFARSAASRDMPAGTSTKGLGFRIVRGPMTAKVVDPATGSLSGSGSPVPASVPEKQIAPPAASSNPLIDFFTKKPIERYTGPAAFAPVYTVEQHGYHWLGHEYDSLRFHQKEPPGLNRFRLLGYAMTSPQKEHERLFRYLLVSKDRMIWRWQYGFQSKTLETDYVLDGTSGFSAELKIWVSRSRGPGKTPVRQVTLRGNGNSFFFRDDEWQAMSSQQKSLWVDKGILFYLYDRPVLDAVR